MNSGATNRNRGAGFPARDRRRWVGLSVLPGGWKAPAPVGRVLPRGLESPAPGRTRERHPHPGPLPEGEGGRYPHPSSPARGWTTLPGGEVGRHPHPGPPPRSAGEGARHTLPVGAAFIPHPSSFVSADFPLRDFRALCVSTAFRSLPAVFRCLSPVAFKCAPGPLDTHRTATAFPRGRVPGGPAAAPKEGSHSMSDIPDTVLGKIEFFEQHIPVWAAASTWPRSPRSPPAPPPPASPTTTPRPCGPPPRPRPSPSPSGSTT